MDEREEFGCRFTERDPKAIAGSAHRVKVARHGDWAADAFRYQRSRGGEALSVIEWLRTSNGSWTPSRKSAFAPTEQAGEPTPYLSSLLQLGAFGVILLGRVLGPRGDQVDRVKLELGHATCVDTPEDGDVLILVRFQLPTDFPLSIELCHGSTQVLARHRQDLPW